MRAKRTKKTVIEALWEWGVIYYDNERYMSEWWVRAHDEWRDFLKATTVIYEIITDGEEFQHVEFLAALIPFSNPNIRLDIDTPRYDFLSALSDRLSDQTRLVIDDVVYNAKLLRVGGKTRSEL